MRYVIGAVVFTFLILSAIKSGAVPVWFRRCRPCGHEFSTRAALMRHRKYAHRYE